MTDKILRIPAVVEKTGYSRASIYRLVALNQFPRPRQLGARAVGWFEADIETWLATRQHTVAK